MNTDTGSVDGMMATQVRHPWRATIRTIVEMSPLIAVAVVAFVDVVKDMKPEWIVGWGPVALAVSGIVTRTFQHPAVDALLTRWLNLGAKPRG